PLSTLTHCPYTTLFRSIFLWQAELRTRLRRTQALTARTYEALHGWPDKLTVARQHPEYELAYSEAEPLISVAISTYHSPDTLVRSEEHTSELQSPDHLV